MVKDAIERKRRTETSFCIRWALDPWASDHSLVAPFFNHCPRTMLLSIQAMTLWLALPFTFASPLPQEASIKNRRSFVERDGTNFTVFEHAATGARMEFVANSGICETTPGVSQYSGYLSVGTNQNMWFWLYETWFLKTRPTFF